MSDKISHVGDADFSTAVLGSDVPVLVDFWAEWCGPCKAIAPLLDDVAKAYDGKVKIVKINIDDNPQTPRQYSVRGIPTLMMFKGGKVAGTHVGLAGKPQLTAFIDKSL
jgi:thioredoxin 1